MKATDLMIGDWVCVNGLNAQVFELAYNQTEKELTIGILDPQSEVYYCYEGYDHAEPIPLTAEILEKNGFKHYAENMYENYELSEDYYSIEAKEVNDGLWRIKVEHEEIFNDTEICSVSYIHQLQQFFRLCGIEKEIVL